ncbi:MAG: hypothetical protein CMH48_13440 [Muricauda sp.]|nr:hypothetical protein [Allomuricauda sp.]MBC31832.1 hypothetical protein [Allomuricauda sp.]|tara:strand:- start:40216 stop:41103 length:888 start_codon:yes stop_codon:yes gene_type:complete
MKKNIFKPAFVSLLLLATACTTDSESDEMPNLAQLQADVEEITNTATTGPWIITNFVDSGKNETADFEGYGFSFNQDGSLVADNGNVTVTGTWSVTIDDDSNDDSNDDSSSNDNDDDCNSCTVEQLTEVLTACEDWFVDKLERNDNDLEDNFTGYDFNFTADGVVTVTAGMDSYSGTWEASGSGNNIQVVLTISGLSDFEDTWTLHEIELYNGESKVDMRINGEDRLRFKNGCTLGNFDGGQTTGEIDFNIFFASPENFSELSDDWNIVSYSATKIELIDESSDGEIDLLTFEKQ